MMTLYRLVRLIENNSHALASCLLDRVQNSEATPEYARVPAEDLKERVYEIYRHLGDWLMTKDELDLEQRYLRIGARCAKQEVPFSQVAWAIVLTKDNLWEFLKKNEKLTGQSKYLVSWRCFSYSITSSIARFTTLQSDLRKRALKWRSRA